MVLKEDETIDLGDAANISALRTSAPLIYRQIVRDVEEDHQMPEDYLLGFKNPAEYFFGLARYCREQITQAEQCPMVLEIAAMVKSKRAILRNKTRESFAKFQIMLDNELYKAMKALREARAWRLKTLEPMPASENGFVLECGTAGARQSTIF